MRLTPRVSLGALAVSALALQGCPSDIPIKPLEREPTVTIMAPEDGATTDEATAVDFAGKVVDPDGLDDIVTLEWASDLDGVLATLEDAPPDGQGLTQFAATLSPGTHAITLKVMDHSDQQAVASISLTVDLANYLPEAEISVPAAFARFDPGEPINLVGAASDPNQEPETLQATWLHAPESGSPRTPITTLQPTSAGSVIGLWEDAPIGIHRIYLVVEDAEGNTDEAQVSIEVIDPNANDQDLDGFPAINDCNDNDAEMAPGRPEACDGKDNDCNGIVDDKDLDADDHIDLDCSAYTDALLPVDDCDDGNGTIFPGAAEQDDDLDNDCDGTIDEGLSVFDNDGDCFCTASSCTGSINAACTVLAPGDCDDTNASLHPRDDDFDGASPCDGDCDDSDAALNINDVDGDSHTTCAGDCDDDNPLWTPADLDGDGASACAGDCDDTNPQLSILDTDGDGASTCQGDCNDSSAVLNINDVDGDSFTTCEGDCDDDNALLTPVDVDADGHSTCEGDCDDASPFLNARDDDGDGYSTCQSDCDDANAAFSPADVDQDTFSTCQGDCNDLVAALNPLDVDSDGASSCDGDCNDNSAALNLNDADGDGYNTCQSDCNDASPIIYPGAAEIVGDGIDQSCDGQELCYRDADNDGYRHTALTIASVDLDCNDANEGAAADGIDCNDNNANIRPGVAEITGDNVDQNCDGQETCYRDADNDNYRHATLTVVSADTDCNDANEGLASDGVDCNDNNATIRPGASETVGDGIDQNCNGQEICYRDADNDNYRHATLTVVSADADCNDNNEGAASDAVDCYDSNANARPGQTQFFFNHRGDGSWDYNCDGTQEKSDKRTTLYVCDEWYTVFPPDEGCDWTNGWETGVPGCGDTENWGTGCFYFPIPPANFCEANTLTPVDIECR